MPEDVSLTSLSSNEGATGPRKRHTNATSKSAPKASTLNASGLESKRGTLVRGPLHPSTGRQNNISGRSLMSSKKSDDDKLQEVKGAREARADKEALKEEKAATKAEEKSEKRRSQKRSESDTFRVYYPAGSHKSVHTSVGEVTDGGLDAEDLTLAEILELESLVTAGLLTAEGPTHPLDEYLGERVGRRRITAAMAARKPYSEKELNLDPATQAARSAEVQGRGVVLSSVSPSYPVGTVHPGPGEKVPLKE